MPKIALAIAAAAVALPVSASASIIVLGSSAARSCYEAAAGGAMPNRDELVRCDVALEEESLTPRDRVATHVNRGIVRIRRGDLPGAIFDFERATALDPEEPEAYLNRGTALLRRDQVQPAISMFTQALERHTQRPAVAYYHRGVAHEEAGDIRAAYMDYRRAAELEPEWSLPRDELTRFRVVR